jgi:hypothetical protein
MNATTAINTVLSNMANRIKDADGGVIAIPKDGEIGFGWNSEQMAWAYYSSQEGSDGNIHYGVDRGEDLTAPLRISTGSTTTIATSSMISTNSTLATTTTAAPNCQTQFRPVLTFPVLFLLLQLVSKLS